jgi:hypothetical protein
MRAAGHESASRCRLSMAAIETVAWLRKNADSHTGRLLGERKHRNLLKIVLQHNLNEDGSPNLAPMSSAFLAGMALHAWL